MRPWLTDLRHAFRNVLRGNHILLFAILILCVGIGSTTALFSVVNGVLLRPLPFQEPDRLVHVGFFYPKGAMEVYAERAHSLESIAAYLAGVELNLTGNFEPVRLQGSAVSAQFFQTLGTPAQIGRVFNKGDDQPGADRVAVLSETLWRTRFHSDSSILGTAINLDGNPYTVIGVMPKDFQFPLTEGDLWVPTIFDRSQIGDLWGNFGFQFVGRLKPGATIESASNDVRSLAGSVRDSFPWKMPADWGFSPDYRATSLQDWLTDRARARVLLLFGAVLILFLISCANVANLLLARAVSRSAELALRSALGGSSWQIFRHVLAESIVVAAIGGLSGLLLANWLVRAIHVYATAELPRLSEIRFDSTVMLFGFGLALLTTVLCGTIPAWRSSRLSIAGTMSLDDRRVQGTKSHTREVLVITEVAMGLVLLTTAGLVVRSLQAALDVNMGFSPDQIASGRLTPSPSACKPMLHCVQRYEAILDSVRAVPGVIATSAVSDLPMAGDGSTFAIDLQDHPRPPGAYSESATRHAVMPGYFNTMRIPLLGGRDIGPSDTEASEKVTVVNRKLAQHFWPHESAVGKHIKYVWQSDWRTIVGVVGDVREDGHSRPVPYEFYIPAGQSDINSMVVVARIAGSPATFFKALPSAVMKIDPTMPVSKLRTMNTVVADSTSSPRFLARIVGYFAFLALILSAMGIYGIMEFSVRRRTAEMGVRLALGSSPVAAFRLIFVRGLMIGVAGIAIGLLLSLSIGKLIRPLLFGITPTDPASLVLSCVVMAVVSAISVALPARRILSLSPMSALRNE